jgi:hypothetical protein
VNGLFLAFEFQESEIISLILAALAFFTLVLLLAFSREYIPRLQTFFGAFGAMCFSYIFTVVEGFWGEQEFWYNFFNGAEHTMIALAGVLFLIGALKFKKQSNGGAKT